MRAGEERRLHEGQKAGEEDGFKDGCIREQKRGSIGSRDRRCREAGRG